MERNIREHGAIAPSTRRLRPEHRMRNRVLGLPLPILIAPESSGLIPPAIDEIEILPVRHLVLIDCKRGYVHTVRLELVVPTECLAAASKAKGRLSCGNLDHRMSDRGSYQRGWIFLRNFPAERQLMQHVCQRLDMHQAMLNGHVEQCVECETVASRPIRIQTSVGQLLVEC